MFVELELHHDMFEEWFGSFEFSLVADGFELETN